MTILVLVPIMVALITQALKAAIDWAMGRFSFASFYELGGMPSGHSSFVTSAVTVLWLVEGAGSPVFMLSIILAIVVFRDAITLRQRMGEQSRVLNKLIEQQPNNKEYQFPVLSERVGHSSLQVLVGIFTGFILTVIVTFSLFA